MNHRDETRHDPAKKPYIRQIMIIICLLCASAHSVTSAHAAGAFNQRDSSEQSREIGQPGIHLRATSGTTITFYADNDQLTNDSPADPVDIPHLVLSRNTSLTPKEERTLLITISDFSTPASGATVGIRMHTQHGDPDLDGGEDNRITVWQEINLIEGSQGTNQPSGDATIAVEFDEMSSTDQGVIPTPTDYYSLELVILDARNSDGKPLLHYHQDYAFLLERQSTATLSHFEAKNEKGPEELVVYYCDMFPFQRDGRDATSRLPRQAVAEYIQTKLLPEMVDAIHLQTETWGMSWNGWISYRDTREEATLGVALSDGKTWYHGPAPDRGNSSITINTNGGNNAEYETLSDGLMSTFHHELFHNFQRAISLAESGSGNVEGKDASWLLIAEGMASFVATVAEPQIQFAQSGQARAYMAKAIQYVGGKGFPGELNVSYKDLNPYHGAMYWRFLYEQCGGMARSGEYPATGMALIRRILEVLYSKEVVDIHETTNLVQALPPIMDVVLSSPEAGHCPFSTFADSLVHFARSIYSLHLDGGRCPIPACAGERGFYDPNNLYSEPKIPVLNYSGAALKFSAENQPYPGGIKSSFGMDFVDLELRPDVNGQQLTIELQFDNQDTKKFDVQVIKLRKLGNGGLSGHKLVQVAQPARLGKQDQDGTLRLTIPVVHLESYNRLGVIITRVDANEDQDSSGAYTLVLRPSNT